MWVLTWRSICWPKLAQKSFTLSIMKKLSDNLKLCRQMSVGLCRCVRCYTRNFEVWRSSLHTSTLQKVPCAASYTPYSNINSQPRAVSAHLTCSQLPRNNWGRKDWLATASAEDGYGRSTQHQIPDKKLDQQTAHYVHITQYWCHNTIFSLIPKKFFW